MFCTYLKPPVMHFSEILIQEGPIPLVTGSQDLSFICNGAVHISQQDLYALTSPTVEGIQYFAPALNYSWVPLTSWLAGVLLQWILILFSSFAISAVFILMHKNFPCCCFNKITVLQEISASLHTHQNHNILQILPYYVLQILPYLFPAQSNLPNLLHKNSHTHMHIILKILHLQQLLFSWWTFFFFLGQTTSNGQIP